MSYEETIRAKHQFEDAFKEALRLISILNARELELAAAKIGDGLKTNDELLEPNSAILTARLIQMVLDLRSKGVLSQSKVLRVWMRRKKKAFAQSIAKTMLVPGYLKYEAEKERVGKIRDMEHQDHLRRIEMWQRVVEQLSFFEKLFEKPPHPGMEKLTPLPTPPLSPFMKADEISRTYDFGEIVIQSLCFYQYPQIQYADEFVVESNVRETAIQLLETRK